MTQAGLSPSSVVGGRYRIVREIGRGSMGRVYAVEHLNTGEVLAMKVLLSHATFEPSLIDRFKREARVPALIKSPHVVRVLDAGSAPELGGAPFLVMELLEGCDLQEHLRARGKLSARETLDILEQIARALDRAHAVGIVHRDLKPANVFLQRGAEGTLVRVLDFGISRVSPASLERAEDALTQTGMMVGTPLYMPPEQAVGAHDRVGPGSDVWAVGMLAFRLLSGEPYWKSASTAELMAALLAGPKARPSEFDSSLPPAFDRWFARSCARDIESRFASVAEQIAALARALGLPEPVLNASAGRASAADSACEHTLPAALASNESRSKERGTPLERRSALRTGGERRQVTGLFCRVTPTSNTGDLDPEVLRDVILEYRARSESVLHRYGPAPSSRVGDGLLVYFGYPRAFGDDAARAVLAALEMIDAVAAASARSERERGVSLRVSVGIHTGIVVVDESTESATASSLAGQAPDLAMQIEAAAPFDGVFISLATERLLRGAFEREALGRFTLRGLSEPVELLRVVRRLRERPTSAAPARSKALIGRASELGLLLDRWEQASTGSGQIVFVSGEAGIGKSRLVEVARQGIESEGAWLECACSPYFTSTALYPVLDALAKRFRLERDASVEQNRSRLDEALGRYALPAQATPLIAHALDLATQESLAELNLSPQRQKRALLEGLVTLLLGFSEQQALAFVVEDLHWADPSTLELLELLAEQCTGARLLVLLSARPDFSTRWASRSNASELKLSRLSRKRVESLIAELSSGRALPREVLTELLDRTDGVPLFVEELTRAVLEASGGERDGSAAPLERALAIPSTLRDSLAARLDRLGPARATAQLAATIGRDFHLELLAAISPLDDATLRSELAVLERAELVVHRGLPAGSTYSFRHSLIQEAAYDSLLKSTRREAHARIAELLIERFQEHAAAQPELLAYHFERAERLPDALTWLGVAGQRALERSAPAEAERCFARALAIAQRLPESRERLTSEALVRTRLGVCLMFLKGYAAPEVEDNYARALVIDRELGGKQPLPVLWGVWIYHHVRGRYPVAYGLSEQLLALARDTADTDALVCAHLARGSTALLRGMLDTAHDHLEQASALYDPELHASHAHRFGHDPGVFSRATLSWSLWLLGRSRRALEIADSALALGRSLAHPNSLAFALAMKSALHFYRRESESARSLSEELLTLCAEQNLAHWAGRARMIHGWAHAELSRGDNLALAHAHHRDNLALAQGLDEALAGRIAWQAIGSQVADTHWSAMLIELHTRANDTQAALDVLARAFAFVEESDERSFEPELYRLKAELLVQAGDLDAAEQAFLHALDVAERQRSRSLGLRASTGLRRLYEARAQHALLQQLLARTASLMEGAESTAE